MGYGTVTLSLFYLKISYRSVVYVCRSALTPSASNVNTVIVARRLRISSIIVNPFVDRIIQRTSYTPATSILGVSAPNLTWFASSFHLGLVPNYHTIPIHKHNPISWLTCIAFWSHHQHLKHAYIYRIINSTHTKLAVYFQDAFSHLFKRLCPSVGASVRPWRFS